MKSITILHLSDLQFGKNHRFAGRDLIGENPHDTLFGRIREDLEGLQEEYDLHPDLIIVTGDLTEYGLPSEFAQVRKFLEQLTEFLHLERKRVAIVPGNHDVNRSACEAYFSECRADERDPQSPFWPKWKHYRAMFQELYKDELSFSFTLEEPWTLFEVPELNVVIAGLNSTIAESHDYAVEWKENLGEPKHYGWLGEPQLWWFKEKLQSFKEGGWLRIAAVHHNYYRGCLYDDENLRDADTLEQILADSLHLLLHGHTHQGAISWIKRNIPVLSTGSAALKKDARPDEMANQYQLIKISAANISRYTRCYYPDKEKWGLDPRGSAKLDSWITQEEVQFRDLAAAFPDAYPAESELASITTRPDPELWQTEPYGHFTQLIIQACRLRNRGAKIRLYPPTEHSPSYLAVAVQDSSVVRLFPVGICEHGLTARDLARFLTRVDARYRANDPAIVSELVYGGSQPPPSELIQKAMHSRVRVMSLPQYQGILDLRAYVEHQTQYLSRSELYPPHLYVPQRMKFAVGLQEKEELTDDALGQIVSWVQSPSARFILVLGDFGTGKTFLLHELARSLGASGSPLAPLLVPLRTLEKVHSLDKLIAQHLAGSGVEPIDLPAIRYMLAHGRIVMLFDGFDELALRVSYDLAAEHFDTLVQAADGDAKVVVTSRTQHFQSEHQIKTVLGERADRLTGLRYCKLLGFTEPQIRQFLVKHWDSETTAEEWMVLLRDIRDLLGLSENPRMLGFITELEKEKLLEARERQGSITAALLYRMLLERWLGDEFKRAHPPGTQIRLSLETRWQAVTAVALRLWQKSEAFVTPGELSDDVALTLKKLVQKSEDLGVATHLIGTRSLLVLDDEGGFRFVHQSVMEWLVANAAAEELKRGASPQALSTRELSSLMADFFCDLAGKEEVQEWARATVTSTEMAGELTKNNALLVLRRFGEEPIEPSAEGRSVVQLSGQDLRGCDLSGQDLRGAVLVGTNLIEARLVQANLSGANLEGAVLRGCNLTEANLSRASLRNADCSNASFLGADLRDAVLSQSCWQRAKLIGAKLEVKALAGLDKFGFVPPGITSLQTCIGFASLCFAVAISPDGLLIASGHSDGSVRLWDAETGSELRHLKGHEDNVCSVAFSPNGDRILSGSSDRSVRLWKTETGAELRCLTIHKNEVTSVAFSPNGRKIVSGSGDRSVRLWDAETGEELRCIMGHYGWVNSVAFSPDGSQIVSGSDDQSVRLWDAETGEELRRLAGHKSRVFSVAFSPDGRRIVSGGNDCSVRLWDAAEGEELFRFAGHEAGVREVALSPDGQGIVSSSDDKTLRLWDIKSNSELCRFYGHDSRVHSVAFSPDGQRIVSGSDDRTLRLWDAASGLEYRRFKGCENWVRGLALSPDGRWIVSISGERTLRLWDIKSGREIHRFQGHDDRVTSVAFSPNGRWIVSGSDDKTLRLWDATTGLEQGCFQGHDDRVTSVAFSPNGHWIASGSDDATVRLWLAATGLEIHCLRRHIASVRSVAFSPDGCRIVSSSEDKNLWLWDVKNARGLFCLVGHRDCASSVAFSSDGRWIVSGSYDKSVRLWDAETGQEKWRRYENELTVNSIALSPDGHRVVSGGGDKTVRIWDLLRGGGARRFRDHEDWISVVTFTPDGRRIVSGSNDNTVRVWGLESNQLELTLVHFSEGWLAFTPDGRYKHGGNLAGGFWYASGLCRFEPGELDPYLQSLHKLEASQHMLT